MNRTATGQVSDRVASYEDIAFEYYDHHRHPTCRDLRELSMRFLVPRLRAALPESGSLVEMGPGVSILASHAAAAGALSRVILVDSSPRMLSYSSRWISCGARSVVAQAHATGLPSGTVSLIVSSLGDPYNSPAFWREVARLLNRDGTCLFTTPSFDWSSTFRLEKQHDLAEFLRTDGARLLLPSNISNEREQVKMIENAGLLVEDRQGIGTEMLDTEPAPKLLCVRPSTPVIAAYVVRAPRAA
jgi:SAM-dependent methyltransferase